MNQNVLTTYSIVSITYMQSEEQYCLMSRSLIRNEMFLSSQVSEKDYESSLFYPQIDGTQSDLKLTIEFGQKIILRHKLSNKYLSYSENFEEEENDTTCKLKLSHKKQFFKIMPCFHYQTKISNKIRFNEDVHIVTEIIGARTGFLSSQATPEEHVRKPLVGLNHVSFSKTSKFSFNSYYEFERENIAYTFGSIIWISHIESATFISAIKMEEEEEKKELVFENIEYDKDLQSVSGLWLIESSKSRNGGKIGFGDTFRLKNISQSLYMSFSKNYKMKNNERVYNMTLDEEPSERSQFVFKSLKGSRKNVKKGSYLIFQHHESKLFIGCRKANFFTNTEILKPISQAKFEDEDLYKIIELEEDEEEAIRFILSLNQELEQVQRGLEVGPLSERKLQEDKQIFENILEELLKLKGIEKLFQKVQRHFGVYIKEFACVLSRYRVKKAQERSFSPIITEIVRIVYQILKIICLQHRKNQQESFACLHHYVDDIFMGLGEITVLIETFRNNNKILCKVMKPLEKLGGKNIVRVAIEMVERFSLSKNDEYWQKMNKFLEFLRTLIFNGQASVNINQRLISEEFFGARKSFTKILFGIQIFHGRMKIEEEPLQYVEVQRIHNPFFLTIIEEVFKLFSLLCQNHNFISKNYLNQFLLSENGGAEETLIAYLDMPITERMSNSLYSLITNLYVDSSPRINRYQPLSVINFAIKMQPKLQYDAELSSRLNSELLNKMEDAYSSRPLQISNLLMMGLKSILQPSLNQQQLTLYKEQISERMNRAKGGISPDLLRSILFLIRLESYSDGELIEIYKSLIKRLKDRTLSYEILICIMQIMQEVGKYRQEVELKKMTAFLKYRYRINECTINYSKDIEYILPYVNALKPFQQCPNDVNQSIAMYNGFSNILAELQPDDQLKNTLFSLLITHKDTCPQNSADKEHQSKFLAEVYTCFQLINFPKRQFLRFLMTSIVITNEEVEVFDKLFDLYKKLKYLIDICEYWIYSENQSYNLRSFIKYMVEVTQYLHEGYTGVHNDSDEEFKVLDDYTSKIVKEEKVYVNRQLLLRNIGFHQIVLDFLKENLYLIEFTDTETDLEAMEFAKARRLFSLCFQFMYGFIYNCNETKEIIHRAWNVFDQFQAVPQVGQTHIYIEFYKNNVEYIREVKKKFIEKIINKIVKNPRSKTNQGCQFNPRYLKYLMTLTRINGHPYKPNLEAVYRLIEKPSILRKILFGEGQEGRKIKLCLNMYQIKTNQFVQVPFLYHIKIFDIFNEMIIHLDSQSTIFKSKICSLLDFNSLLSILYGKDIYTHKGVEGQMNFLLKREVLKLVISLLEQSESISLLQDNENLLELINFYYKVFVSRPKRLNDEAMNGALYQPYLAEYSETLNYFQKNQRTYFKTEIIPFLEKIDSILKKAKNDGNSPICLKIQNIFEMVDLSKMNEFFEYRKMGKNIDKITFKWLNFIDKDEDNSPEEKFVKFTLIEILRDSHVCKKIDEESQDFLNKMQKNKSIDLAEVLIKLLRMKIESQYIENESQQTLQEMRQILITFWTLITDATQPAIQNQMVSFSIENRIGELFISYCSKAEFDFTKVITRKIFHQILKILICIIKHNEDQKLLKELFTIFNENPFVHRFWSHLNESIELIQPAIEVEETQDQVNWCIRQIYLIPQEKQEKIYEQVLQFLQALCQYYPFTKLLRYQPSSPSWDFLQKVYHSWTYVLMPKKAIKINVLRLEASEVLLTTISAFMNGGNQSNQNFVVDNKFPQMITEILKIESLRSTVEEAKQAERDRLVNEVIEFYQSNGIDLQKVIRRKIRLLNFNHLYLLNRLKFKVLWCLLNCLAANEAVESKIRFKIPSEILKVNLIWVYNQFKDSGKEFSENMISREPESLEQACQNPRLQGDFLKLGFYIYFILNIKNSAADSLQGMDEDEEGKHNAYTDEKEKGKEKLVMKFFNAISDRDRKHEKMEKLKGQKFEQEMMRFYEEYYTALDFFQKRSISIEVNFHNRLITVNFCTIPLCKKLTTEMINEFKHNVVRISHDEKIKGLLEFEQESYNFLQGEEDFFKKFDKVYAFQWVMRNVIEEDRLRVLALISCIILTILFMVRNFSAPSFKFSSGLLEQPASILQTFILLFGILNLIIGFFFAFYLFLKKVPVLVQIYMDKEQQRVQKERNKFLNGKYLFVLKKTFRQIIFVLLYVGFLVASFIHPFFAGVILFDVMNRLNVGRQIIRSVMETWLQLLAAIGLLIVINYLYTVYVYVQFSSFYSPACEHIYQCLLLLLDQSLKSDSGFLGSTPIEYGNNIFDLKFFSEILYIIFAQKIIFQIFSGIIIDKFSELREHQENQENDENTICYICGQERFLIDFELEGFEEHICKTHNAMNYVFYLYYLRRKNPKYYSIVDQYISECQGKRNKVWIPKETSILKIFKEQVQGVQEDEDEEDKMKEYLEKKTRVVKEIRMKGQMMISELREKVALRAS